MDLTPPLSDWKSWLLVLAGLIALAGAPGYLAVGWWARRRGWVAGLYASVAAGILLAPLVGRGLEFLPLPLRPSVFLAASAAVALAIREALRWSARGDRVSVDSGRVQLRAVAVVSLLLLVMVVAAYRDFLVPPHWHDATNHAFLTQRILESRSLAQSSIFSVGSGMPDAPYLPTWHVLPAMIAGATGVPPWVTMWMFVLLCLGGVPLAMGVLWHGWGLRGLALTGAVALLLANQSVPAGLLGWGGFTAIVGFFVAPGVVWAVREAVARGSVAVGVAAGLATGSLALMQPGLAAVALICGLWWGARDGHGLRWTVVAALVLMVGLIGLEPVRSTIPSYLENRMTDPPPDSLGRTLNGWANALGRWHPLKVVLALGLLVAFRASRLRWIAVMAAALSVLYVTTSWLQDPVSRLLAVPWYREPSRIRDVLLILCTPLAGVAVDGMVRRAPAGWSRRITGAVLLGILVIPGAVLSFRNLRESRRDTRFEVADASVALRAASLGLTGRVANARDDGSAWAWQLAGLDMLLPCGWRLLVDGEDYRPAVRGLQRDPWPPRTLALRDAGVQYVWTTEDRGDGSPAPATLANDPRFEPVVEADGCVLYRIHWASRSSTGDR